MGTVHLQAQYHRGRHASVYLQTSSKYIPCHCRGNISTKKKLYDFKGWESSVRCCDSSPALDMVAVGCSDGSIHVHNIQYDEELMSFNHQIRGAVTALSFRTGNLI